MKVHMIANASINFVKKNKKGEITSKGSKEFDNGKDYDVTDKQYQSIKQSCMTEKEWKAYQKKMMSKGGVVTK